MGEDGLGHATVRDGGSHNQVCVVIMVMVGSGSLCVQCTKISLRLWEVVRMPSTYTRLLDHGHLFRRFDKVLISKYHTDNL